MSVSDCGLREQKKKDVKDGKPKATRSIKVATAVSNLAELEDLIRQLQTLKAELAYYEDFELKIEQV